MRKFPLRLVLAVVVLASVTASHANIFVKISDGTTTLDGTVTTTKGGFTLKKQSLAPPPGTTDVTDTLTLLTCAVRPCTAFFPSGLPTQQGGDTFKFQDVSSTAPFARVEKFDSGASADRVSFKGIKITSVTTGKTLTVTYGVQSGDLRTLTTSGSYPGAAALSGTFRTNGGTGLTRATACKAGTTSTDLATPCVKLTLKIDGTTLNSQGSTAIATVAVACNNSFPTVNPCGTNGIWSSTGSFTGVNDTNSISCPSPCAPVQVGTLVAVFSGSNEALQLTSSATGALANVSDQNGGLEEIFLSLADELGANRWVAYTAANELCRAVPTGTTDGSTRNVNNQSTIPLSFEVECGFFAPLPLNTGVDLLSIVDRLEITKLIGSASTRNDASRVGFLPGQLTLKGINGLSFTYDVFVSPPLGPSGNNTLGDVTYTDCTAGSLRVELQLLDDKTGAPVGTAKVYLGHEPADHFQSGCDGFESIGTDLVNNPDARVDASGLLGNLASRCCTTFKHLQLGLTGQLIVRKVSLVVDHGNDPSTFANHKATFFDGNVNGITASSSLQIVTGFQQVTDLPTNGVSMVIRKLTLNQARVQNPPVVKIILDPDIQINGGQYRSQVNVNNLNPDTGGTQYSIDLCLFGAVEVDSSVTAITPRGRCIPAQAIMTLL